MSAGEQKEGRLRKTGDVRACVRARLQATGGFNLIHSILTVRTSSHRGLLSICYEQISIHFSTTKCGAHLFYKHYSSLEPFILMSVSFHS